MIKNYQLWEGTHHFYFGGKLMFGPKVRNLIMTFMMINIPSLLNFAFTQIVSCHITLNRAMQVMKIIQ